jgi:hypothetical protein
MELGEPDLTSEALIDYCPDGFPQAKVKDHNGCVWLVSSSAGKKIQERASSILVCRCHQRET